MSGPRLSRRALVALGAALALAASAFGGLLLPRLADAELPASMTARAVKASPSPARQKLDDALCHGHHVRQVRLHRPDGALPGV